MSQPSPNAIEQAIDSWSNNNDFDSAANIVSSESVSGGCINTAEIVTLTDGRRFFVKSNQNQSGMFASEAAGLVAIGSVDAIGVPEVIGQGKTDLGIGFLVLEFIQSGSQPKDFFEKFGRSLAMMHRNSAKLSPLGQFGLGHNNYIGSTPQHNAWSDDWATFFAEHRIGFQWELANEKGLATREFNHSFDRLVPMLPGLLNSSNEPPALIHGDLWSGNFMVAPSGEPFLIDPAVYFGSREAEFGMTKLFGGFNFDFYHAYNEAYPLTHGWEERVEIYKLYHLMNHLNLFGSSYLSGCLEILRKFC